MKMSFRLLAAFLIALCFALAARAAEPLPRATPESQGVSSAGVRDFIETADAKVDTMHGFVLVRHDKVVAEGWWKPQSAETKHVMHSLSKSFTSTAVGLAIAEGKLSLDDLVMKFFPDDVPADASENVKQMRVRDLLIMSTGHKDKPALAEDVPWTKAFFQHPVEFKPGTHFFYNSAGTYVLSAIVQKVTGQTVLDYLKPRLFDPIGIDDPEWLTSPQGISTGGWGLSIRTEDIARFGLLYLHKGKWNGRQLLSESWIEQATSKQTSNGSKPDSDWDQGYGYQFWRCRHNAYRGDGAFGQFCIVLPDQDAVIAITSDAKDMQGMLNVVWDKLLPAMRPKPLEENASEQEKLRAALANLSVKPGHVENTIALPPSKPAAGKPR